MITLFIADKPDTPVWKRNPILQQEGNMAFGLSSDGLSMYKSTNKQLWPVMLMNFNLPPAER
jgi:hypothetical protein